MVVAFGAPPVDWPTKKVLLPSSAPRGYPSQFCNCFGNVFVFFHTVIVYYLIN